MTTTTISPDRFTDHFIAIERQSLLALARKEKWFHNMHIGDYETGSWVYENNLPPNYHLYPTFQFLNELDLKDAICLDVGTFDGMGAFSLTARGAARVDATCQYDLDRFRIARALLGYSMVAYYPKTDLALTHQNFSGAQYDLVLMTAMLHHLLSPIEGLLEARRLLKQGGYLLIEALVRDGEPADFKLNIALEDPVYGCPTLWISTAESIKAMLRMAGFNPVAEIHLIGGKAAREPNYDRVTLLAQAVSRDAIIGRTEKLIEFHSKIQTIGGFDYSEFESLKTEKSTLAYSPPGDLRRYLNIWSNIPSDPLQPAWQEQDINRATFFKIGENSDFCRLVERNPDGAFTVEDLRYLPSRYPGQCMPEGMRWGLKQLGNLHVLDFVKTWGLIDILEVGPGFNLYFPNHLPEFCNYTGLDDDGFYKQSLLQDADLGNERRKRVAGLLGKGNHRLMPNSFDACVSVSVLEHVPWPDVAPLCKEMFSLLRPGGWALHSIDVSFVYAESLSKNWLTALIQSGFEITNERAVFSPHDLSGVYSEPNSIVMTFWGGLRSTVWDGKAIPVRPNELCILVALRKPLE